MKDFEMDQDDWMSLNGKPGVPKHTLPRYLILWVSAVFIVLSYFITYKVGNN